jgi:outer membrane protein OmpA-like peptidoglycan-associated protein
MRTRAVLLVALLAATSCVTGGKLRETHAVVRSDVEKAKRSGAARCAPRELATAEANVDFAEHEMAYGDPSRAAGHLRTAEASIKKALEMSQTCAPTQVTIAKNAPEKVRIEKTDTDGDGVPDVDDRCPDVPGRPELAGCPDTDGDGVPDAEDQCPREPGPVESQGCPVAKDTDGDGIPDDVDRCPLDPEDKDGFQDEDGCPDPDNDGDGIVDKADACPNEGGSIENRGCPQSDKDTDGDGILDSKDKCPAQFGPPPDGCPKKYSLVDVDRNQIRIKQQVRFATGKYRVLPASHKLLDQVASVMSDFPKMRIVIEGHTDSRGKDASNMRLSSRRAESVLEYLVARGIAPSRVEAIGYGSTKPIATNRTAKGRATNRRTEFKIVALE